MPVHTALVLFNMCEKHRSKLKLCKQINKEGDPADNPYSRIKVPIYLIVGKKDHAVDNKIIYKIYK